MRVSKTPEEGSIPSTPAREQSSSQGLLFSKQKYMKKRNSLIEFYRFFFAMNVVKNHGYFPYQGSYFTPGRISVEFFFVLSGWFLFKGIEKYMNLPFWKGLFSLIKNKLFVLGIPLVVGLIFNIPYKIIVGAENWWDISIWGYLWYVHDMFMVFIFYYTIRRFVKNNNWFIIITASVFVLSVILHSIPFFFSWGYFRAFSAMSCGILISFIPQIKMRRKWILWIPLSCVMLYILKIFLFNFTFVEEEILDYLLYPALIYLTFQFDISNAVLNYLGALSFGLYAYQSIPRLINILGYDNTWVSFAIILSLTIITDLVKRLLKRNKNKCIFKDVSKEITYNG